MHTVKALDISAKTPASLNNVSDARKNAKTLRSESTNDVRELVYVTTALTIKSVDLINNYHAAKAHEVYLNTLSDSREGVNMISTRMIMIADII